MRIALRAICVATALALASCTTTVPKSLSGDLPTPPPASNVLVVKPDVHLAILNAGGTTEPKADWSNSAQANLNKAFTEYLSSKKFVPQPYDFGAAEGRPDQLIKLHGAVGQSILMHSYGVFPLPTHPRAEFKWTLGPGTKVIADTSHARYALFITAQGTYASAGRVAAQMGLAILGVGIPLGSQQMYASLVDLQSGDVIWFNVAVAGPSADMRTEAGAKSLITSLMTKSPL